MTRTPPIPPLLESEWLHFRPTISRTVSVLRQMGHPQRLFPHILVGGTNGKGTVCWNLAQHLPGPVGLFTSPHLCDVRERILIDREQVADDQWQAAYRRISTIARPESLSYFEWLLLVAVDIFARHRVRWAVFEVGLGGRLDATNSLDPTVSVITRVGLDHTAILGETQEQIALEKIEIARSGRPLVLPQDLLEIPSVVDRLEEIRPRLRPVALPQPPRYSDNRRLVQRILQTLKLETVVTSLQSLPGRRQRLAIGAGVFLDVAHNPMAWADCARWVSAALPANTRLLCGLTEGRDPEAFLSLMKPVVGDVFVWRAGFDRELDIAAWPPAVSVIDTSEIAELLHRPLLVCGSIYLIGRFMAQFSSQVQRQ